MYRQHAAYPDDGDQPIKLRHTTLHHHEQNPTDAVPANSTHKEELAFKYPPPENMTEHSKENKIAHEP